MVGEAVARDRKPGDWEWIALQTERYFFPPLIVIKTM